MIPSKVEVEGFLCYREKQVVDLGDSDLWVFSGRNGSGKSSIFDAITFALFGVHRGGKQGLEDLINAGSSEFRVAFEFELETGRYKITRGLRRGGNPERLVYRHEVDALGKDHWFPVAETHLQNGLDRWIGQNVGLNYEMFTCSTLLRQGHAEKLLEATPKQRFEIVAEVADLKSYQLLHEKAEARRKIRKGQVDGIRAELSRKPIIEQAAIEEAGARLSEAEEARARAATDLDRLAGIEGLARLWRELTLGREKASGEANRARRVIEGSATIEADRDRLRELDAVLPILSEESDRRSEVGKKEHAIGEHQSKRDGLHHRLDKHAELAAQARGRLAEVDEEIAGDEARKSAIDARLLELAGPIARADGAAGLRRAVTALEEALAAHPDGLEADADRLAEEAARRAEWRAALPRLEDLAAAREGLAGARSRIESGGEAVAVAEARARHAAGVLDAARDGASRTRLARQEADRRSAEARATLRSVQDRWDSFEKLEGLSTCNRCGQALTPERHDAESRRLREELDGAGRAAAEANGSLLEAEGLAESAEGELTEGDRLAREADARLSEARRALAQAGADARSHEAACIKAFGELEESFRLAVAPAPVADWVATTFPTPADLARGRRSGDGWPEAERLAREARTRLEATRCDRLRLEEARRSLESFGLRPGDEQAGAEHRRLAEEAASLDRCLKSHRLDRASAEEAIGLLNEQMNGARGEIAGIDTLLATDRALIEASRELSARARLSVPDHWHAAFDGASLAEIEAREAERRSLRARGVEELAEEVPRAHWALKAAEAQIADLDSRLAEIPEEARRDPEEIAGSKARAAELVATAEKSARERQRELDALRRESDTRAELEARALEADGALAVSAKLAELLGRGSLQRDLIRDAERGILDSANPILREISGDDLELRLSAEDSGDDQALLLEVVDRTHGAGRPVGVSFLSGSQKFRVAVSLALGIGRYAQGLDRPIRSVIIDEGFGGLDRQGRDEMIAQLAALKGRLARIVLVSHQEEFADAFKDGYHFEARDDSTVVREFHR